MITRTSAAFAILVAAATPAFAQIAMYPGQEVQVNPGATSQTLLYPGGKYGRTVPALLAPGQNDTGIIHLHMPVHHRTRVAAKPKPPVAVTAAEDTAQAIQGELPADQGVADVAPAKPAPARPAPAKPAPAQTASAEPTPDAQTVGGGDASIPFSFDGSAQAPAATPKKPAAQKPQPAPALASNTPPPRNVTPPPSRVVAAPSDADHVGLTRRSQIVFPQGASDPTPSEMDGIKGLAGVLNTALQAGAKRVQLEAYGGTRGDKSSDARRISLKRALSIRQTLIDDGVPAEKIDVRAMGGADDRGPADRVDVFLRAG